MRLLGYLFFAGAVLFSLGEMGFLTEAADNLLSFLLVLVFIAMHIEYRPGRVPAGRRIAGIVILVLAAFLVRWGTAWRLLALALVPAAVLLLMADDDIRRRDVALLAPATVFFTVAYTAIRHVAYLWWLGDTASLAFSEATGRLIGQAYAFGGTASGLRVMLFTACWGLARLMGADRRRGLHFAIFLLIIAAVTAMVQVLLTPLAIAVQLRLARLDFLLFNSQVFYVLASLMPVAWYSRRTARVSTSFTAPGGSRRLPLALAAGLLVGLGITLMPPSGPAGGGIVILDEGLLNWRVPVFGFYGERSGGMFGRLPGFLEAQGYDVKRVPRPVTAEAMSGAKTLVIINLMHSLTAGEIEHIWEFVQAGGSLLIMGDHTGVMGIRKPFNEILEPVNIEFEFDSATFWAQGWRDALELMPHPINRDIVDSEDIQIWIGASLKIGPPAAPVIVGKYGYSDIGDETNLERSYLGDRRHNPGEKIGDLVLVAGARHGRGRVLVFGDTSTFQNGALVSSWAFAQSVFLWLMAPSAPAVGWVKALLLAAGAGLMAAAWRSLRSSIPAWLVFAVGLAVAAQSAAHWSRLPELPRIDMPKALVDFSHGERFDQLTWYDDCAGGLEFNLMRNGYSAHLMNRFSESLVRDSEVLVVIAPSRPFAQQEIKTIVGFMEAGGLLILTTGYEEKDRSEPILAQLGVSIENVPLAHFEVESLGQTVHFAEAWPLDISDTDAVAISRHPDYVKPVAAFIPRGRGGALVIGDSQFLLNANLESLDEWHDGNIMFLREIFNRFRTGELGT